MDNSPDRSGKGCAGQRCERWVVDNAQSPVQRHKIVSLAIVKKYSQPNRRKEGTDLIDPAKLAPARDVILLLARLIEGNDNSALSIWFANPGVVA